NPRPGTLGRGRGVGVGLPPDSADHTNTVANIIATQQIRRAFAFMFVCDLAKTRTDTSRPFLPLFEIARVLVRFDHIASFIVNADHKILLFTLSSPRSPCSEKP